MHKLFKSAIVAVALTIPAFADPTMKITFNGTVDPVDLSSISKMTFAGTDLLVGTKTYGIKNISKIEFIDNTTAIDSDSKTVRQGIQPATLVGNKLTLSTSTAGQMNVSLFAMTGRKVAELFSGNASAGTTELTLDRGIASGIYALVIVQNNSVISQKVEIQ